ncbi:MAG: hypothetical protein AAF628_34750 [Planctomycetota bacterium]
MQTVSSRLLAVAALALLVQAPSAQVVASLGQPMDGINDLSMAPANPSAFARHFAVLLCGVPTPMGFSGTARVPLVASHAIDLSTAPGIAVRTVDDSALIAFSGQPGRLGPPQRSYG